jgi:hypothetical protein
LNTIVFSNNKTKEAAASYNVIMGDATTKLSSGAVWSILPQLSSKFSSFVTSQKHIDQIGDQRPSSK